MDTNKEFKVSFKNEEATEKNNVKGSNDYMLTTIDNPFNPWTQFESWNAFDLQKGYCSCALLARFVKTFDDAPDDVEEEDIREAIDDIIKLNPNGLYTRIYR